MCIFIVSDPALHFKICQTVMHACNTSTHQAEVGRGSVAVLEYIQSSWLAGAT